MKRKNFLLVSFLAMAMTFSVASCSSSSDDPENIPEIPGGGTETPGGGNDNPGGNTELTAAQAKQKLDATAQELLGKMNVNDLQEFKTMIDGVDYEDGSEVSEWFEACGDASTVSDSEEGTKYLIKASNFVGEFTLLNGVWKQTKRGGDHLSFIFNDKNGKNCVLTLKGSSDGTLIHHDCFDDEGGYWDGYKWQEYKDEYRFILPKKMELTLSRNGEVRAMTTINTEVKTAGEIDLTKDEVELSSVTQIVVDISSSTSSNRNQLFVVLRNYSLCFCILSCLESRFIYFYLISTNLITVTASATGNIDNNLEGTYGKVSASVDILGKAKVVATLSDVNLLIQNLDKADENDENESLFKQYLENANRLIDAQLYLDNSSKSCAKVYLAPIEDGYGSYKYWDAEPWLEFSDGSKYSYSDYFNEKSFKTVVDKVQSIVDDFIKMFD